MNHENARDDIVGAIRSREYDDQDMAFAKGALLDWTMVALAGIKEPVTQAMGHGWSAPSPATLSFGLHGTSCAINATASHALDYDDVSTDMRGHPSVCVIAATLEAACHTQADGRRILSAICAGHEVQAVLGALIGESHYAKGFHTTATFGTFGAMAAYAYLHEMTRSEIYSAINLCATQASGLKEVFGSFYKPAQAGLASQKGYLAAQLVRSGLVSPEELNALEGRQGFFRTQGEVNHTGSRRTYSAISNVLYKYHASCYLTHSMIEALHACISTNQITPKHIEQIVIQVHPGHEAVCNIQKPGTGLEIKFSLRFLAAMAAHGISTADISSFTDALAGRGDLQAFAADRVRIEFDDTYSRNATVMVLLADGRSFNETHDVSIAETDSAVQWEKLCAKAIGLNLEQAGFHSPSIIEAIEKMDRCESFMPFFIKAIGHE